MMKYSKSHEWVKFKANNIYVVGITEHAQKELGEIVYLELPKIGREIQKGEEVAVLESTKAAADIYSPVSGTIVSVNTPLSENLDKINSSPEVEGWLYTIALNDPTEIDELLEKTDYETLLI